MEPKIQALSSKLPASIGGTDPETINLRAQGTPRPMRMSNTFDPNTLLIAISPLPLRATMRLHKQSGRLVPMVHKVKPMTVLLSLRRRPALVAHSIIKKTSTLNQRTEAHTQMVNPIFRCVCQRGDLQS